MLRYQTTLTLAVFNVVCLGLVALGFAYGFLGPVFQDDVSKLSSLCGLLLLVVIAQTTYKGLQVDGYRAQIERLLSFPQVAHRLAEESTNLADFIKTKVFLYAGLTGTVIGLTMVIYAMNVTDNPDPAMIKTMIAHMKESMKTAFYATGVGIVCKTWVEVITFILANAAEQIRKDVNDLRLHLSSRMMEEAHEGE